jgi:CheY-like chemotaxis protein
MNATEARTNDDRESRAGCVLVVDDEPALLRVYSRILTARGVSYITASSATEALAHIQSGREFAALLTDVHMPGMSGLELAATVRARGLRIPIVFLTAVPHTTAVFTEADGAAWCLGKPVSCTDFARMMDIVLCRPPDSAPPVSCLRCL